MGIVHALKDLLAAKDRRKAAMRLAQELRTDEIIVFLRDPATGTLLPAPGFPQTLPDAMRWKALLRSCLEHGSAGGCVNVVKPESSAETPECDAYVVTSDERSAAYAFLGNKPSQADLDYLLEMLPFVAQALNGERAQQEAAAQVRLAQDTATNARSLAETLHLTRSRLQHALSTAEKANRAKDEFLAIVSHELRSPLNAILGWVQLMRTEDFTSEELAHGMEVIERNAKSQAELIEDIIDFERITTGKLRLDVQSLNIIEPIAAAIDTVRPSAEARGIQIESMLDTSVGMISGDSGRLQQIVWNLLTNAIKFSPKGGTIQVLLKRVDSHIECVVSDHGIGLEPEFLPHIFERFRQVDSTTTRSQSGLGLGLAIVRHLVEMHGGTIQATSAGKDQGTTMTLQLPVALVYDRSEDVQITPAIPAELLPKPATMEKLTGLTILVVDDRYDARDLLEKMLVRYGANVLSASSAQEAFELYITKMPDLLVSDIEMPGEDGYSLMRTIRAHEQQTGRHIPAIALTAHARAAERKLAISAGFQVHVTKPFEPAELLLTISNLVKPAQVLK